MSNPTRRRVLRAAAIAGASALGATASAGEPPASADQALTAMVRLRFKHLTEEQIKTVQRSIQNLEVVRVDVERNLLLVRGAVPGAAGGDVIVRPSVKAR